MAAPSTEIHRQLAGPGGRLETYLIGFLQAVFAIGCIGYAIIAFDYFISFATGNEGLWLRLMAFAVSDEYTYGAGSVHVDQHAAYTDALRFMLMHTTMGAVCMAIGPFQFVTSIRRKYPQLHRTMGKIYLLAVMLSMFAGLGYLAMTPFIEVYSGPPFAVGLVALDLAVLYSAVMAYRAIRQTDVFRHQAWMAMNYALLLPTPVLRLFWVVFGVSFPTLDQAQSNLAITTFLLPVSMLVGMVWIAAQRPTRRTA